MSADRAQRRVTVSGPHVEIEVVDGDTAAVAQQYLEDMVAPAEEVDQADEDNADADTGGNSESADATPTEQVETITVEQEEDDGDEPADDPPWAGLADRDERVEAFVDAMYEHEGEPFETTAGDIARQLEESGVGVSYSLKDMDDYVAEQVGEAEGAAVWRIAPAPAEDATDDSADVQADDSDEQDDTDDVEDIPDHAPVIELQTQSSLRQFDADEVVDAIADVPTVHRAKASLGLSKDAMHDLLERLDLRAKFDADAPLSHQLVRETVAGYLEVDG